MASKESIEVSSIKPGPPENLGLYTRFYVILDTVSTYHDLGRFLSRVESHEKFMRVENINIKRLSLEEGFEEDKAHFKPFDVKGHIVINTVVLNR